MTYKGQFSVDVYNCTVHITVADTDDGLLKSINYYLRKYEEDTESSCPRGYAFSPKVDMKHYYIFFGTVDLTVDTFNHEKSHIIDFILEDRDLPTTDEARSYLDGYISHKMNNFLTHRKLKIKNHR